MFFSSSCPLQTILTCWLYKRSPWKIVTTQWKYKARENCSLCFELLGVWHQQKETKTINQYLSWESSIFTLTNPFTNKSNIYFCWRFISTLIDLLQTTQPWHATTAIISLSMSRSNLSSHCPARDRRHGGIPSSDWSDGSILHADWSEACTSVVGRIA